MPHPARPKELRCGVKNQMTSGSSPMTFWWYVLHKEVLLVAASHLPPIMSKLRMYRELVALPLSYTCMCRKL